MPGLPRRKRIVSDPDGTSVLDSLQISGSNELIDVPARETEDVGDFGNCHQFRLRLRDRNRRWHEHLKPQTRAQLF
jgi:hypothetical protein